jgi:hypothetical protein
MRASPQIVPNVGYYWQVAGASMRSADAAPEQLLANAASCGNPPHNARLAELVLQQWIEGGLDLEAVNYKGETALLAAVAAGDAKVKAVLCRVVLCCAVLCCAMVCLAGAVHAVPR